MCTILNRKTIWSEKVCDRRRVDQNLSLNRFGVLTLKRAQKKTKRGFGHASEILQNVETKDQSIQNENDNVPPE